MIADRFIARPLFRDRAELFAFAGLIAVFHCFVSTIVSNGGFSDPLGAIIDTGGVSAVAWFAAYAVLAIAREDGADPTPSFRDLWILAAALVLLLIPIGPAAGLALFCLAAWLLLTCDRDSRSRRIGVILLALSGPYLWGHLILELFGPLVLGADAHLAATLAGQSASGNMVQARGADMTILIGPRCSSIHNVSLAFVLWATLTQSLRIPMSRTMVLACALAVLAMVLVNVVRLAAMARFPEHFEMLHYGVGATIAAFVSLVLAGSIIGAGILADAKSRA